MTVHALIIGIDKYDRVDDGSLAGELPGSVAAAKEFRSWLCGKLDREGKSASKQNIHFCSFPTETDGIGATRADIEGALDDIGRAGKWAADEFYFFFSGHGFSIVELGRPSDILVAADYANRRRGGAACINLDEVVYWLRASLGPGRHYYFVDACRARATSQEIRPTHLTLPDPLESIGEPSTFVLQSANSSQTAPADDAFFQSLIGGLKGKGNAKVWTGTSRDWMAIRYDSLRRYIVTNLGRRVDSKNWGSEAPEEAIIDRIAPPPKLVCTIRLASGSKVRQAGSVACTGGGLDGPILVDLVNGLAKFNLEPGSYTFSPKLSHGLLARPASQSSEIYDDTVIDFDVDAAEDKYAANLNIGGYGGRGQQDAIMISRPTSEAVDTERRALHVSENLERRLILTAGSEIMLGSGTVGSGIRVLLGPGAQDLALSVDTTRLRVSNGAHGPHGSLKVDLNVEPGPQYLSIERQGVVYTVTTHVLANHTTLVVVLGSSSDLFISQYLIAIPPFQSHPQNAIIGRMREREDLKDLQHLIQASQAFRARRDLFKEMDEQWLQDVLAGRLVDPIGTPMICYELARRGQQKEINVVLAKAAKAFPLMPDLAALEALSRASKFELAYPTLFLDGLKASKSRNLMSALQHARLDFVSTWTAWWEPKPE